MARRLTTNQEIPGSTPGVIIFALLCHVKMVALKEKFFVWFKRSTDVVVGCTFPPKFCPSIAAAHRNRGHCAYRFSINSSRCLFFCTCTLKTSMSSRICFVLKLAEIKQFGLSRLAQQTFKPSPDEVEATPTPSLMAHLFIAAISWHLLPDTALHLIMEA